MKDISDTTQAPVVTGGLVVTTHLRGGTYNHSEPVVTGGFLRA